jgi:pyruvate dehydrogenase E2 component (dihydrolipoamide acetyltransferase)
MAELVNMPRLSDTMEEGTVAKWFIEVGDFVKEGDILAEIETDKATMEFESFQEGVLLHIGIQEGGTAPVDSLLAIIGEKGEDISAILGGTSAEVPVQEVKLKPDEPEVNTNEKVQMPDGVEVITMPRLSDTMEEGTVAKWNKKVGDKVSEGDILAEIETDKATMEFESFYSGVLLHIGLDEGASAPVDSVLAAIGKEGTNLEKVKAALSVNLAAEVKTSTPGVDNTPLVEDDKKNATVKPETVQPQKPIISQSLNGRLIASPLAKKLAEEKVLT